MLTCVICGFAAWHTGLARPDLRPMLPVTPVALMGWVLMLVATGTMVALHRRRILALVLVGIVGLIVSCTFVYFSAPDLALTQITVEVVTVILMLLALNFLPKRTVLDTSNVKRGADAFVAALAGLGVGILAYAILRRDFAFPSISSYMVENSYKLGGGDNVVNVILVDFRGFDTFGEIIVLGIGAVAQDPQRQRKAFRIFLESVLLEEFGRDRLGDPGFDRLVDQVLQQLLDQVPAPRL